MCYVSVDCRCKQHHLRRTPSSPETKIKTKIQNKTPCGQKPTGQLFPRQFPCYSVCNSSGGHRNSQGHGERLLSQQHGTIKDQSTSSCSFMVRKLQVAPEAVSWCCWPACPQLPKALQGQPSFLCFHLGNKVTPWHLTGLS